MARIHAVWGLGQLARNSNEPGARGVWPTFEPLLADVDPEVRAQTARVVGEARVPAALAGLIKLLSDTEPRVHFFGPLPLRQARQRGGVSTASGHAPNQRRSRSLLAPRRCHGAGWTQT